jgi:hypothetical protein
MFSMALGEWVSVHSQRDSELADIKQEEAAQVRERVDLNFKALSRAWVAKHAACAVFGCTQPLQLGSHCTGGTAAAAATSSLRLRRCAHAAAAAVNHHRVSDAVVVCTAAPAPLRLSRLALSSPRRLRRRSWHPLTRCIRICVYLGADAVLIVFTYTMCLCAVCVCVCLTGQAAGEESRKAELRELTNIYIERGLKEDLAKQVCVSCSVVSIWHTAVMI